MRLQHRLLARSELTLKLAVDEAQATEMAEQSASVIQKYQLNNAVMPKSSAVHQQDGEEDLESEGVNKISRLRNTERKGGYSNVLWKGCLSCGRKHLQSQCKFKSAVCQRCSKK